MFDVNIFKISLKSHQGHVDEQEEDEEAARARVPRARPHREAPQALWRPRQRRRTAPPPHQLRQVPPGILRKGESCG